MKKPLPISVEAQKIVASLLDYTRSESSADAYTVVPALLLLGRHTAFQNVLSQWADSNGNVIQYAQFFEKPTDVPEVLAVREYARAISLFNRSTQQSLLNGLRLLNLTSITQGDFEALFDYTLDLCISAAGRSAGEWTMPTELVELVATLADAQPGERIFNPYANTAPIVSWLESSIEYTGLEENVRIRGLAQLRLIAHNRSSTGMINVDYGQWPSSFWDVICSVAPIIPRKSVSNVMERPASAQIPADVAAIHQALACLKEGGRAIMAVPQEFLFRSDRTTVTFRQKLVAQGYLESVVEFPSGLLLPYAALSFSLLTFRVNNPRPGEVIFIDAASYVTIGRDRRRILQVAGVLESLNQPETKEHTRLVTYEELANYEYSLVARRYIASVNTHPDDVELGNFSQLIRRTQPALPLTGRFVGIRQLLKENADYKPNWHSLNWAELPIETVEKTAKPLTEDALLVATQFGSLKPTWYAHDPQADVLVAPSITALKLDLTQVDVEYLVTELNSDYVLQQLKALQVGSTIPTISKSDLLRLRVRLPKDISLQRAVVAGIREQLARQKLIEVAALRANVDQKAENFQQFAALKHSLGGPQMSLAAGISRLERVITRYSEASAVLSLDSPMNAADQAVTVRHTLDALKQAQQFIFDTLNRNEHQLILKDPLEPVELVSYLRGLVDRTNATHRNFTTSFEGTDELLSSELLLNKPATHWVQATKYLLDLAFDNILGNANRHGFKNTWAATNRVVIRAFYGYFDDNVAPNIVVMVQNNGAPFPLNFEPDQLFRRGEAAGETRNLGFGGHDIKEIFGYFGGTVKAASSQNDGKFTVSYTINLPLSAAETNDSDVEEL